MNPKPLPLVLAGLCAGAINGLLGSGGGMVLVPMLTCFVKLPEQSVFPSSVCIILPVCLVTLLVSWQAGAVSFPHLLPYLLGSLVGGVAAGLWGRRIPVLWLHRCLGLMILWGGVRYLC